MALHRCLSEVLRGGSLILRHSDAAIMTWSKDGKLIATGPAGEVIDGYLSEVHVDRARSVGGTEQSARLSMVTRSFM